MRRLIILMLMLAAVALAGCRAELPKVERLTIAEADYPIAGEWPSRIVVEAEVENGGRPFRIVGGRLRVGLEGRRVVVLTLEERVRVGRGEQQVMLPLKVSVARSSQSLRLREMIRRGEYEGLMLDWQLRLRSGVAYVELEEPEQPIEQLLDEAQRRELMELLKSINQE